MYRTRGPGEDRVCAANRTQRRIAASQRRKGGLCGVGSGNASGRVDKAQGIDTRGAWARWTIDRWTGGQEEQCEEWNQLQKSQTERGGRRTSVVGSSTWRGRGGGGASVAEAFRPARMRGRGSVLRAYSCSYVRAEQPCHFDSAQRAWVCLSCEQFGVQWLSYCTDHGVIPLIQISQISVLVV